MSMGTAHAHRSSGMSLCIGQQDRHSPHLSLTSRPKGRPITAWDNAPGTQPPHSKG
jgi:hypothetical protein